MKRILPLFLASAVLAFGAPTTPIANPVLTGIILANNPTSQTSQNDSSLLQTMNSANTGSTTGAQIDFTRSRGTIAVPANVTNGDKMAVLRGRAYSGGTTFATSEINFTVDGTFTSGQRPPSRIDFFANAANSAQAVVATVKSTGVEVTGNITASNQLISSVATGTAPLVVASTTLVANLHAATADTSTSTTTATNAMNTAVTDDTSTNATMYPTWVTATTGNLPQKLTSTKLTFNPSTGNLNATSATLSSLTSGRVPIVSTSGLLIDTGSLTFNTGTSTLTTGTFAGNLTGNASTATTATTATNATNVATTATSTNANYFLTFVPSSSSSNQALGTVSGLFINPSTGATTFPGPITASGTGAGAYVFPQGSTQSVGTTAVIMQAPAAVTSYIITLPGAVGSTGILAWTVSGSVATLSSTTTPTLTGTNFTGIPAASVLAGTMVDGLTITTPVTSYTATLASDDTFRGEVITGLNNSGGVTQWDAVYLNSSSQWVKADANGSGTYPAVGIATATATTGNATTVLIRGVFRDDGGTSWTVGGNLYLSTTAGGLTSTPPATTGDKVQVIGTALAAHTVYVHPGTDYGTAP